MSRESDLLRCVTCDPETGVIRWKLTRGKAVAGQHISSKPSSPYETFVINGRRYLSHRVVWWFAYGTWPNQQIDHINGQKRDNRIANLRDVAPSVNRQNLRRATAVNKTGALGVWKKRGKFAASIFKDRKSIYLGTYQTAEQAHAAYLAAKRQIHEGGTL